MGGCHNAPVTAIGHALHEHATVAERRQAVKAGETHRICRLTRHRRHRGDAEGAGYKVLEECLAGKRTVDDVIKARSRTRTSAARGVGFPNRAQMALRARRGRGRA